MRYWFGSVPSGWKAIKLKFLCKQNLEKTSSKSNYVGLENIESNTSNYIASNIVPSGENIKFSKGDILFGKLRPYLAKVWRAEFNGCCSSEFFVLTAKEINPDYLKLVLISPSFIELVNGSTFGAKMPRSNWEFVGNQFIPVPPLEIQRCIAYFVAKSTLNIDALSKISQSKLELLSTYRQSLITRAVTKGLDHNVEMKASGVQWIGNMPSHWRICRVKNLFSVVCGATPSPNPQYWNGNINWIGPSDMDEIGDVSSGKRSITREGYESCGTTLVPQGSLVLSTRAPVGKVNIAKEELCTNQGCKSLVPLGSKNYTKYYYFVLQAAKDQLIQDSSGTTFLELSTSALSDELLPLPSLDEQKRIVSFLEKIDEMVLELKVKLSDSIRLLNEYRSNLISAAVTGQLAIEEAAE